MDHRIHTESDLDAALASLIRADARFAHALSVAGGAIHPGRTPPPGWVRL
jgi:hypothetical protein